MSNEFKIVDKRRGEADEQTAAFRTPASLTAEDIKEVRVKPEELFLHPFGARIIVQGDSPLEKVGRIFTPQKVQRAPTTGVILEIGPDVPADIYQVGMRVAYGMYSGTVLTFKGWDPKSRISFRMLGLDEILGWVDQNSPELEGVGV